MIMLAMHHAEHRHYCDPHPVPTLKIKNPCADGGRGCLCRRLRSMITAGDCVGSHVLYSLEAKTPRCQMLNL